MLAFWCNRTTANRTDRSKPTHYALADRWCLGCHWSHLGSVHHRKWWSHFALSQVGACPISTLNPYYPHGFFPINMSHRDPTLDPYPWLDTRRVPKYSRVLSRQECQSWKVVTTFAVRSLSGGIGDNWGCPYRLKGNAPIIPNYFALLHDLATLPLDSLNATGCDSFCFVATGHS
jgi:hypothetical protein